METTRLSLLIPTYNEADIIEYCLNEIGKVMSPALAAQTEIFIVDDGTDNLPEIVKRRPSAAPFKKIEVIRNSPPLGKGKSLTKGFMRSTAPICGFLDVDLSTPPQYIQEAYEAIATNKTDIFIGSRKIDGSVVTREQFFLKDILGDTLGFVARSIIFSGMRSFKDTQCGFKFYKTPVANVLYEDLVAGDGLNDLEVLIRANLLGYRVQEKGVVWTDLRESKRSLRRILWGEIKAISKILVLYKVCAAQRVQKLIARKNESTHSSH